MVKHYILNSFRRQTVGLTFSANKCKELNKLIKMRSGYKSPITVLLDLYFKMDYVLFVLLTLWVFKMIPVGLRLIDCYLKVI